MAKKRYHCAGTITMSFIGHIDMDDDDGGFADARTLARDALHDGLFAGSYDIVEDEIEVDPNAEEIEF